MKSRIEKIEAYRDGYEELKKAISDIPTQIWKFKASSDTWSIHEAIIHLADMEANGYIRLLKALAEPGGVIMPLDQNAWTDNLMYHQQDCTVALEVYRWLRIKNYELLKILPEYKWINYMTHPESGQITVDTWLDNYVDHGRRHIQQIHLIYKRYNEAHHTTVKDS